MAQSQDATKQEIPSPWSLVVKPQAYFDSSSAK